jgi:hypothetical protein
MYVCMHFYPYKLFVCLCVCVLWLGHVPTMQRDTSSHLHSAVWQVGVAMWKHRPRLEEIGYEDVAPEVLQEGPHQVGMRRKCIPQTWSNMFEINTTVVECWQPGGSSWFPVIFHLSICPDMSQTMWNKSRHFFEFFLGVHCAIRVYIVNRNQQKSTIFNGGVCCTGGSARVSDVAPVTHLWEGHWRSLKQVEPCPDMSKCRLLHVDSCTWQVHLVNRDMAVGGLRVCMDTEMTSRKKAAMFISDAEILDSCCEKWRGWIAACIYGHFPARGITSLNPTFTLRPWERKRFLVLHSVIHVILQKRCYPVRLNTSKH